MVGFRNLTEMFELKPEAFSLKNLNKRGADSPATQILYRSCYGNSRSSCSEELLCPYSSSG